MKKVLLVLVLPLLLGSCSQASLRGCQSSYQAPNLAKLDADLAAAQTKWAQADIKEYSYTIGGGVSGEASGSQTVTVSGDTVIPAGSPTMEKLFAEVKTHLDGARASDSCTTVAVSYDANDGHLLSLSWSNLKQGIVDAFGGYSIRAFQRH